MRVRASARRAGTPAHAVPSGTRSFADGVEPIRLPSEFHWSVRQRIIAVAVVCALGGSWWGFGVYSRAHQPPETADQRAILCSMIEEHGEEYVGELADCRHRVATLRAAERR